MNFLVVGLGNPGKEYEFTRHNIGFMVIENLGKDTGINISKKGFKGLFGHGLFQDKKVLLFKPETFMNNSGKAVKEIKNFYKIPTENVIVVHDELDLELGSLKIKFGGGTAGHKGLDSIVEQIGDDNYSRIKVGIGKPYLKGETTNHVLSPFSKDETDIVKKSIEKATDATLETISHGVVSAMNKFNKKDLNHSNKEEKSDG